MAKQKQTVIEYKKDTIHGIFLRKKKISTEEQTFY